MVRRSTESFTYAAKNGMEKEGRKGKQEQAARCT
jgi:hypothetical protein